MTPSELPFAKEKKNKAVCHRNVQTFLPAAATLCWVAAGENKFIIKFQMGGRQKVIARHKTLFLSHIRKVSFPVVKPETHILFCNFFTRKRGPLYIWSFVTIVLTARRTLLCVTIHPALNPIENRLALLEVRALSMALRPQLARACEKKYERE